MEEWDGGERLKERWKQQAALETGTGTETVVDCNLNCNRNCKGRTKYLYTFFLGCFGLSLAVWETNRDGNSVPVAGLYRASASNKGDLLCSGAIF